MTATTEKKKREPMHFSLEFVDATNEVHKRIPDAVTSMRLTQVADGKSAMFGVTGLPATVKDQLAMAGLRRVMEVYVRNHLEDGQDPLELANEIYGNLASGSIYTRSGSGTGKAGRVAKFDTDFWREVISMWFQKRNNGAHPTDKQIEAFVGALQAREPKDRNEYLTALKKKNPVFAAAVKIVEANRAEDKVDAVEDDSDILADL